MTSLRAARAPVGFGLETVEAELPALAGLELLATGEPVAAWSAENLGIEPGIRASYLRLTSDSRASVLFDVALPEQRASLVATLLPNRNLMRRAQEGLHRLEQLASGGITGVVRRSGVAQPLATIEGSDVLLEWFPASLSLPGLALDGVQLRAALGAGDGEPVPVVYKPERRVVLAYGELFVRAYARPDVFARALWAHRAAARLGDPFCISPPQALSTVRLLTQARVDGAPPAWCSQSRRQLGSGLARLHASREIEPALFGPADQLCAALASARLACRLLPRLRRSIAPLVLRCLRQLPAPASIVISHGDMSLDQAIETPSGIKLLDPDWLCRADPALDLSSIAAHEIAVRARPLDRTLAELDDVLAGYGSQPRALGWYLALALLRRVATPLSRLDARWKERTEEIVRVASQVVGAGRGYDLYRL